jgi:hypothetical protein
MSLITPPSSTSLTKQTTTHQPLYPINRQAQKTKPPIGPDDDEHEGGGHPDKKQSAAKAAAERSGQQQEGKRSGGAERQSDKRVRHMKPDLGRYGQVVYL